MTTTLTDLLAAIAGGADEPARLALVNAADPDGVTPLHVAARHGKRHITRALLDAGAVVDALDAAGWTPGMAACAGGHADIVEMLLAAGMDPTLRTKDWRTALEIAAARGFTGTVTQLLASPRMRVGASEELRRILSSATLAAASAGQQTTAVALVEAGAPADAKLATVLVRRALERRAGGLRLVQVGHPERGPDWGDCVPQPDIFSVEPGEALADVDGHLALPASLAAFVRREPAALVIVGDCWGEMAALVRFEAATPGHGATQEAHTPYYADIPRRPPHDDVIAAMLHRHTASISTLGPEHALVWEALDWAASRGDVPTIDAILRHGLTAPAPAAHRSPLAGAARASRVPAVRTLLAAGSLVAGRAERGAALVALCSTLRPDPGLARDLIAAGVDLDALDGRTHGTALMAAAAQGHVELVRILLEAGARVDVRDANRDHGGHPGATALHHALAAGWPSDDEKRAAITRLLLLRGARHDARDDHGRTPLHAATKGTTREYSRSFAAEGLLLNAGADIEARDMHGRTPLADAVLNASAIELAVWLVGHGADLDAKDAEGRSPDEHLGKWSTAEGIRERMRLATP